MRDLVVLLFIGLTAHQAKAFENGACDIATRPANIGTGVIMHTPNYPAEYDADSTCEWILDFSGDNTNTAELAFNPFTLEGCTDCRDCDYVEIFDGPDFAAPSLGVFCGSEVPPAMRPSNPGTHLSIRFQSDSLMQLTGFEAVAAVEDIACTASQPSIIRQPGNITSQNYPGNYENQMDCSWLVNGPTNNLISFKINDLGIENCCTCDYVEVFDGPTATSVRLGRFYADDIPPVLYSTNDLMFIQFTSDSSLTGKGFQATIDFHAP